MSLLQKIKALIDDEAGESSANGDDLGTWLESLEEVQEYIEETVDLVKAEL